MPVILVIVAVMVVMIVVVMVVIVPKLQACADRLHLPP